MARAADKPDTGAGTRNKPTFEQRAPEIEEETNDAGRVGAIYAAERQRGRAAPLGDPPTSQTSHYHTESVPADVSVTLDIPSSSEHTEFGPADESDKKDIRSSSKHTEFVPVGKKRITSTTVQHGSSWTSVESWRR